MKIIGATGGFAGMKYNADYSANYTNRSLVDKEYVTNNTLSKPTSPTIGPNVAPTASTSNFDGYAILGKSSIDTKEFDFGSYMPKRSFRGITTNGTYVLATVPIPDAAVDFFEFKYTARNGAYGREVGTIVAFYDATTDSVNFSRTGPVSIGDVSGFDLDVVRNGATLELTTTITDWTWSFCVHTMMYLSGYTE